MTGLPRKVRRAIETHFAVVSKVFAKYQLETEEDYERMEKADLREILNIVRSLVVIVEIGA